MAELNDIKKTYGENFMKLCREFFPSILEQEGKLTEILTKNFATNSRQLYDDLVNHNQQYAFKDYIYSIVDAEREKKEEIKSGKTPYELLDEAGYILYECKTEKEIQSFKKYYRKDEKLCTFNGGRLNYRDVFFAVKKDVDNIKRTDFDNPKREDEYGTSVLGIQFAREGRCTVDIISRYNHTVPYPNSTYGCNLNKITDGLEQSFAELLEERGLYLNQGNKEQFSIPGYTMAGDGKFYKVNCEINGIYYCPGNTIIRHGEVIKLGKNEELIDYFIVDSKTKKVRLFDETVQDSLIDDLQDLKKVEITKNKEKGKDARRITLYKQGNAKPVIIDVDKNNEIIGYSNEDAKRVGNNFLFGNNKLEELDMPNLEEAGSRFLQYNLGLTKLELPKLRKAYDSFAFYNRKLVELNMPNLEEVGSDFLAYNLGLVKLDLHNLRRVKDNFLRDNEKIKELNMSNLEEVGNDFLRDNRSLTKLYLPKTIRMGSGAFIYNGKITELNMPNLEEIGNGCFAYNKELTKLYLPKLMRMGYDVFRNNEKIAELNMPNLEEIDNGCFAYNKELTKLYLPKLMRMGSGAFRHNAKIAELNMPNLEKVDENRLLNDVCFQNGQALKNVYVPKLNIKTKAKWKLASRKNKFKGSVVKIGKKIKDRLGTYRNITRLDKANNLTTTDIEEAKQIIEKSYEQDFEKESEKNER